MAVKTAITSGLTLSARRNAGAIGDPPEQVGQWWQGGDSTGLPAWTFDTQANDLLIVWSVSYDSGRYATAATSTGLTFTAGDPNSSTYTRAFWAWIPDTTKRAVSLTWSAGGSWQSAFGAVFRGVNTTTPFDVTGASGNLSTASPHTVPNLTTATPFSLAFVLCATPGTTANSVQTSGWTEGGYQTTSTHNTAAVTARKVVDAAGGGAVSFSNNLSSPAGYTNYILRPA